MHRVSICLPCLNARRFLSERLDSILAQTFTDWELIAVDSRSDDGSWDRLRQYAAREPRLRLFQAPREGVYAGINACIQKARGEFVYIATADDTMTPDCLEKMVAALEAHPECGLGHCCLNVVDEAGASYGAANLWLRYRTSVYFGDINRQRHIRYAPHDGILHFALCTVYTSLTQLLVRRRVFDRAGAFDTRFGALGDFEWGMRVSLLENTLHVPEPLATWRRHGTQATSDTESAHARRQLQRMARLALRRARRLAPGMLRGISPRRLRYPYERDCFWFDLRARRSPLARRLFLLRSVFGHPRALREYLGCRLGGRPFDIENSVEWIHGEIKRLGVREPVAVS